jgi:1-acyl-sn-glycerol-3-phosphate acyltransferase
VTPKPASSGSQPTSAAWQAARARFDRPLTRVDTTVDRLADRLAVLLYRDVEVRGEVPPPAGAELVLINHGGGFSDPVVLIAAWPRLPRFVARDVIWRVPVAGALMRTIRAVPVHRRQDTGSGDNTGAFLDVAAALVAGQSVAIFPEGDSIDEPVLHPLRTGAARMALAGLAAGADELRAVPVGLHYRDKRGLRSAVLVHVGEPLRVADVVAGLQPQVADEHALVRALTSAFEAAMRPVVPGYRNWDLARDLQDAAAVRLRLVGGNPLEGPPFAEVVALARRLAAAPDAEVDEVLAAVAAYRAKLAVIGLTDAEVAAGSSLVPRLRRRAMELGVALPVAAAGLPGNLGPYLLTAAVGRVPMAPATAATVKPLAATLAFPTAWAWWAWRGRPAGPLVVAGRLLLAPAALAAGFLVADRAELTARVLLAWARRDAPPADVLREARRRVVRAVDDAVDGAAAGRADPTEDGPSATRD